MTKVEPKTEYYYRYDNGHSDAYGPLLSTHRVLRRTPKGLYVLAWEYKETYIGNAWIKKFAYPTIEEAKRSFIARKERQVELLTAQLRSASAQLTHAKANHWDQSFYNKGLNFNDLL